MDRQPDRWLVRNQHGDFLTIHGVLLFRREDSARAGSFPDCDVVPVWIGAPVDGAAAELCLRCGKPEAEHFTSTGMPGRFCDRNRLSYFTTETRRPLFHAGEGGGAP